MGHGRLELGPRAVLRRGRVLDNLWPFWECVIISTLGFSGIRLRNARPRR
ncbi:DUF6886 family protein [Phytohabitans aurantiacus]